jgi:hypothetical protein
MKYEEFLPYIEGRVREIIGKEGSVSINHVIKNNGIELDGLVIMMNDSNIAPTIYLNSYYDEYCESGNVQMMIDSIMETYHNSKDNLSLDMEFFMEFDNVKDMIVYKVINYEQNQKLLEKIPHKKILDLAIVFYCLLRKEELGSTTVLIYHSHLERWNVGEDRIYEAALENTPRLLKYSVNKMDDIIRELFLGENTGESNENFEDFNYENYARNMYVLTNEARVNGAASMFYDGLLSHIANKIDHDLYILPSSIHEVILVPKTDQLQREELTAMVREVNAEGVAWDEILSDQVSTYNRTTDQMTL